MHGSDRRGSALIVVAIMVTALGTMSLALLSSISTAGKRDLEAREDLAARYVAEAAVSEAYYRLLRGEDANQGTPKQRVDYGNGDYWVEREDLPDGSIELVATAVAGRGLTRIQVILVEETADLFSYGAFGDEGMEMDSNAFVDSYNSGDGTYEDQAVNGSGSDTYASENGTVGSNRDVDLASNATVHGDAAPGPGGTSTLNGNSEVSGSTAPSGSTSELPEITVPATVSSGNFDLDTDDSATLPSGAYAFDAFKMDSNSSLLIEGPATLVLGSAVIGSNAEILVDATNGSVEFFVYDDFLMNSNTEIRSTTYTPMDVFINLLSDNVFDPDSIVDLDEVDFDSNAKLYGVVYAPNARIEINSNFELFGALIARSVVLDSNAQVHYDEMLSTMAADEGAPSYTKILWAELTVSPQEIDW